MEAVGVPDFFLCDIKDLVGTFEVIICPVQIRVIEENAGTSRQGNLVPVNLKWRRQRTEYLLRENSGVRGILQSRHQDNEFVATKTGHRIHRSDESPQAFRECLEQIITRQTPDHIVHILEMVEIEEENREIFLGAPRPRLLKRVAEECLVQ
jgi:hypothetical protein